jgi:hypothetical protein
MNFIQYLVRTAWPILSKINPGREAVRPIPITVLCGLTLLLSACTEGGHSAQSVAATPACFYTLNPTSQNGIAVWDSNVNVTAGTPSIDSINKFSATSVNSVYFDGNSQLDITVNPISSFVVRFNFKSDSTQNPWSVMVDSVMSNAYAALGFEFANGSTGYNNQLVLNGITTPNQVNDGNWHSVLGTLSNSGGANGSISLYVDGMLIGASSFSSTNLPTNLSVFRLGHIAGYWSMNWDNSFRGWIDDFSICPQ